MGKDREMAMRRTLGDAFAAAIAFALVVFAAGNAWADRRVALVIGNAAYRNGAPLANTISDSDAIAKLFRTAGFDVVDARHNLGSLDFKRAIREFANETRIADIAVVYFAGHGIEIDGINYVIPVDAKLERDFDAEDEAVSLDRIVRTLEPARRLRLVILDACRDNPFSKTMHRTVAVRAVPTGLGKIEPTTSDTLIAYAAKAGSVSYDGSGPNSPFTTALVKYIAEPGLDIRLALGRVRDEVLRVTANKQEPFVYGSLGGTTVSLVPPVAPKKPEPPAVSAAPSSDIRNDYELAERIGTRAAWEAFLAARPTGFYADLARAQLAKLGPAPADTAGRAEFPKQPPHPAVDRQQQEREAAAKAEADRAAERDKAVRAHTERLRLEQEAAAKAQSAPLSPEQACRRDEERLARLRASRDRDEVVRFERELACERLRPQVVRLRESVASD
jgi:uncharacterized caspase-like protein